MTKMQAVVASAALAIGMVGPAMAAVNDPELVIYRFPAVRDNDSGDNTGVATVFSCTNFSGAQQQIRLVTRTATGTIIGNVAFQPLHLETHTFSTRLTAAYPLSSGGHLMLSVAGGVIGGTTAIAATSTNIICTAMVIDGSTTAPVGVALRGVRFNPAPGSQE